MESDKSVILLEFNELYPSLMESFIKEGKLPNFQRLYEQSEVYTTDAEEQPPFLEPWIQYRTFFYRQRSLILKSLNFLK